MLEKVAAAAPPETEFEYSFMVKRPVAPVSATKADMPTSEVGYGSTRGLQYPDSSIL